MSSSPECESTTRLLLQLILHVVPAANRGQWQISVSVLLLVLQLRGGESWGNHLRRKHKILGVRVRDIFMRINHSREHWLLLWANTVSKEIPFGTPPRQSSVSTSNDARLRYLGDKYSEIHGVPSDEWTDEWELVLDDASENPPKYTNGHDCGLFVLPNATSLPQQFPLSLLFILVRGERHSAVGH